MMSLQTPIPVSDIESVLAWVDSFKLSRPTKKINRDFSDAVLLAEILYAHYPKLVDMHNYPPRNSHALKLNNWMTLNRKVLKKLRLNMCYSVLEQLAYATPGLIERLLICVRDKILRDQEANKQKKDETEISSGGSYYHEALEEDDNVLVIPVRRRTHGVLEIFNQKVINYNSFLLLKEQLKDAKEAHDVLTQKVEHLDNLLKLKEERIGELQKQLERKVVRRKEIESQCQNSFPKIDVSASSSAPPTAKNSQIFSPVDKDISVNAEDFKVHEPFKSPILNNKVSVHKIEVIPCSVTKFCDCNVSLRAKTSDTDAKTAKNVILKAKTSETDAKTVKKYGMDIKLPTKSSSDMTFSKDSSSEIKVCSLETQEFNLAEIKKSYMTEPKYSGTDIKRVSKSNGTSDVKAEVDGVNSEIFVEAVVDDIEQFEDSEQDETNEVTTIKDTIQKEIREISENTQKR